MRMRTAAAGAVLAAVVTAATAACGRRVHVARRPVRDGLDDACARTALDRAHARRHALVRGPALPTPPRTPSNTPTRTPDAARTLVETTVTGGFAGVHDRLVVKDDGTYTTTSRGGSSRSGQMTPAELTALREALEKADFARLPAEATGSPIADGFTYRITHAGRTVTTDDVNRLPALRAVFAALPAD